MAARQTPKGYRQPMRLARGPYGNEVRQGYQRAIMGGEPAVPRPLEYEDIDNAFFEFASKGLGLEANGKEVPTFRLFSNQRFSEYSQTWNHVDEDQNLLMNFKTVHRASNPSAGKNQGGYWNIPGERWYKIHERDVLEDNGTEAVEITSMRQPYAVDMSYKVAFVTNTFASLNRFNEALQNAFKSCQAYIRPNGHYVPMRLDELSDQSSYTVEDRRFYVQQATITVMAYVIGKEDMKVQRFPKRVALGLAGRLRRPKPRITAEEYEDNPLEPKGMDILIEFEPYHEKVEFDADEDMAVTSMDLSNVRSVRVSVNGEPVCHENGFTISAGDSVRIRFFAIDPRQGSSVTLVGHSPTQSHVPGAVSENVSEQAPERESIRVE